MRPRRCDSPSESVDSELCNDENQARWVPEGAKICSKLASFCVCRGIVLEPPCPRRVDGISIDPEPNWNFDSLLSEIESVEKKLNVFSKFSQPLTQTTLRMGRRGGGFVMRVSEDEMESDVDEESDEEEEEEEEKDHSQICTKGKHFACDELYLR
uniref:Uncharacterized protein n=1 Tax=Brassica oleracea var. oleracea TaxID=109376 RepID=A0A0D3BQH8_BRAOL